MAQPGRKLLVTAVAPRQTATLKERAKLTIASYKVPVALELDQVAWATQAIKDSPTNTILCDADMNIIFANHKSYEILRMMAPNLHKWSDSWKSFRADEIVGSPLDFLFLESPEEHQLAKNPLNHPYFGTVRTGPCTCEVRITGVTDTEGNATGYTVYWERITEKLELEKVTEAARIETERKLLEAIGTKSELARISKDARLEYELKALEAIEIKIELAILTEAARLASEKKAIEANEIRIELARVTEAAKAYSERKIQEIADEKRDLAERIEKLKVVTLAISKGDVSSRVHIEKDDVVGQLGSAFNEMADSLTTMANIANQIACGDLTVTVRPHSDRDVLGNAFARMVTNLSSLVAQTLCSSESIASECTRIAEGADDLSRRTDEQACSLEETAASMEEMTSTVRRNADNATQADYLASQARVVAEKGGQLVSNAVRSMEKINSASKKIADVISVIDEIAGQINLLSLTAAVETSRAGKQGRGFAVVAAEVRRLARQSKTAAKKIKSLVQDSVVKADEGSQLVNESGMQLEEIVFSVKKVADIIADISAASKEQATGIEQVNEAIMQMDQITQLNSTLVDEAAAASQMMSTQAVGLQTLVEKFAVKSEYLKTAREAQIQSAAATVARVKTRPALRILSLSNERRTLGSSSTHAPALSEF